MLEVDSATIQLVHNALLETAPEQDTQAYWCILKVQRREVSRSKKPEKGITPTSIARVCLGPSLEQRVSSLRNITMLFDGKHWDICATAL